MGKHRHSKDKMHITYTQLKQEWQGKKTHKKIPFAKLPFYCCALSLSPFNTPVCTEEGHVFDILYIVPFIKKYHKNPVTGKPLNLNDLTKMHWTKNQKGQFEDPISYKVFTEYTHIVCIRTSGYVYAYETVETLNKKPKMYNDLVTNQPFTPKDIITIQDPKTSESRAVNSFDYIKNDIFFEPQQKHQPGVQETASIKAIMEEVNSKKTEKKEKLQKQVQEKRKQKIEKESREDVKGFIQWCLENKIYKHERFTDMNSASLTSTSFTPDRSGLTSYRGLKEAEIREKIYHEVQKDKMKGFVQVMTNKGQIILLLHCDLVPKTCQNFAELCESGYYDNTHFHRLVKNFCLQGGDPTGTGSGGESIFGKPFEDEFTDLLKHSKPGMLSMANRGVNTNTSQFFITLAECSQLDGKHTVFGEVLQGNNILFNINKNASEKSEKPREEIWIDKMVCYDNPFRKVIKVLKETYRQGHEDFAAERAMKEQERWIDKEEGEGFKIPSLKKKIAKDKEKSLTRSILHDYM